MIGAADEAPRPGVADALTFAFGDAERDVFGSARIGIVPGEPARINALTIVFAGDDSPDVQLARDEPASELDWRSSVASAETVEPLRAWRLRGGRGEGGFALDFEALGPPAELGVECAAPALAGVQGYEQVCRVRGTVTADGAEHPVDCLGQRGHQWGAPDWERLDATRTLSAWLDPDCAIALVAVRPRDAPGHAQEAISAFLLEGGEGGLLVSAVADARLSTTYDGDGHQARAGVELLGADEEAPARRAAGETLRLTTLALGEVVLESAFLRWRMEGREGVGRYDILRRA